MDAEDQNRSDERGQSPLIAAASFGQREVVQRLLQAPGPCGPEIKGYTRC